MGLVTRMLRTRWLVRAPIWLYRAGLGALLGDRLLMLQHRGRTTGEARFVVLEVVGRPSADRLVVASGLGPRPQWYRNIVVEPRVLVSVGRRRDVRAVAEPLDPDAGVARLEEYAAQHPAAWAALRPVVSEWAEPLGAARGEPDWRRVVPVVELRLLDG
ncbi:nitroreductase family deazaflavin-dependent oxidoreductase [Isoptericola sediminis]|uniref:Nitroreductase family deazaflavin-dependent oxidoreductase n=1 Tax=Isoptericola sediminis TaxID=2733572 RepID=A0A849K4A5_9MICO|nr:nitroreductase family deazaflavin-dependent oxidoreductase [Isoptericola sediminis]NNU26615.1 nitroreductase family deazaflavin-dependent oxidoreductase [Isoptericola sediminis]